MTIKQFTKHLSKNTSSIFSPTSPREPTPPRDESKGKGIAAEEPLKEIMPFIEEGGLVPKMAQAQKMAEYEAKRKKMFDQLPITKITYRVNSSKEATMRITRVLNNTTVSYITYGGATFLVRSVLRGARPVEDGDYDCEYQKGKYVRTCGVSRTGPLTADYKKENMPGRAKYRERTGPMTADTKKETMSGRAEYRGRTRPMTADTKKENMPGRAEIIAN
nr:hypothetical protein [Tanacetum cinerariifolium]